MTSMMLQQLTPLSDEQVIARVLGGDVAVFELLMRRHNQRLFRVARAVLRNDAEAEDVVQETYLRAYAHLAQFEGRSSVATWLSRIAFHESLRRRRAQRRSRINESADPNTCEASEVSPQDPLIREEMRKTLAEAIDSLSPGLRAVVMLRLVEGLSTRDTADSLHLSEANVKVSLHRARQQLSESLLKRTECDIRHTFTFGEKRCDRIVNSVFARLTGAISGLYSSAPGAASE
jgi:RNA polymerase sigma-70 factor (ECF subfamily)